jgi:formimidoylglutamate deiminase
VIAPLVNGHSHAFQRAFVGLAERRESAHDDFWSWRERMYAVALRISPAQLRAVAAHLYAELLAGGYTQVCEFHYLQHAPDGTPYADAAELALALAAAAQDVGIGLTLLPAMYLRAGFGQAGLRAEQRRFALGADQALTLQRRFAAEPDQRGSGGALLDAGVAVHSLRAAAPRDIAVLADAAGSGPLHIHAAEQPAEVQDCQRALGARPIEWLAREGLLDARWQLVHATHTTAAEVAAVAASGAGVVLCPGTEGNLGDGLPDLPGWLAAGVPLSLGSDSQVLRAWPEELRWLEYGQRLLQRRRNVAALPAQAAGSTAARLFQRACQGRAAGFAHWGLVAGARADLLVIDEADPALAGVPAEHLLDALVFAAPSRPFAQTWVAGRRTQPDRERLTAEHAAAMGALWGVQPAGASDS